jgi:hypothetical protein
MEMDSRGSKRRSEVLAVNQPSTFDLRDISLLRWLCLVGETLMAEMKPSLVEGFGVFLGL